MPETGAERRARLRKADADRLAAALKLARQAIETAEHTWGLWADGVRQDVETRLGCTSEPGDPAILADEGYGHVLSVGNRLRVTGKHIAAMTEEFGQVEPVAGEADQISATGGSGQ
jgi:hypothetical protein